MMIAIEERSDIDPICPHCEKIITTIYMRLIQSFLGKRYLYFCPHCRKTLGVTHRKGFWMG
jgi:ribosomal protein L37AE/L43A